jgi:farnesyl-diphosphate farnesyltransferase
MTKFAARKQENTQLSTPMSVNDAQLTGVRPAESSLELSDPDQHATTSESSIAAEAYQNEILTGVSRTFALTIPQLPHPLRRIVANAYLLCRIADTIEDDIGIDIEDKGHFHDLFLAALRKQLPSETFIEQAYPLVSENALAEERDLIKNTDRVLRITHGFSTRQQDILQRRIGTMCKGMPRFQHPLKHRGLDSLNALDEYCYYVAGVVGEMLTELFCDHSEQMAARGGHMMQLAASFGQGLQMTNIIKDIWDDLENESCWLPRDVFESVGFDLDRLSRNGNNAAFTSGINHLVGIAHTHLHNALQYTLLIPRREFGIRRFCLWSIGLALLTLQRIHRNPGFASGPEVKVSRRTVRATVVVTSACSLSDSALRLLFRLAAYGLPRAYGFPKFASNRLSLKQNT